MKIKFKILTGVFLIISLVTSYSFLQVINHPDLGSDAFAELAMMLLSIMAQLSQPVLLITEFILTKITYPHHELLYYSTIVRVVIVVIGSAYSFFVGYLIVRLCYRFQKNVIGVTRYLKNIRRIKIFFVLAGTLFILSFFIEPVIAEIEFFHMNTRNNIFWVAKHRIDDKSIRKKCIKEYVYSKLGNCSVKKGLFLFPVKRKEVVIDECTFKKFIAKQPFKNVENNTRILVDIFYDQLNSSDKLSQEMFCDALPINIEAIAYYPDFLSPREYCRKRLNLGVSNAGMCWAKLNAKRIGGSTFRGTVTLPHECNSFVDFEMINIYKKMYQPLFDSDNFEVDSSYGMSSSAYRRNEDDEPKVVRRIYISKPHHSSELTMLISGLHDDWYYQYKNDIITGNKPTEKKMIDGVSVFFKQAMNDKYAYEFYFVVEKTYVKIRLVNATQERKQVILGSIIPNIIGQLQEKNEVDKKNKPSSSNKGVLNKM